jgi:hypothetical protein
MKKVRRLGFSLLELSLSFVLTVNDFLRKGSRLPSQSLLLNEKFVERVLIMNAVKGFALIKASLSDSTSMGVES